MARASRRFRKKKRNPERSYKSNPPLVSEVLEWAAPGLLGFAVTRTTTKLAVTQIQKRAPQYAGHAGAIASIGTFIAAWFFLNRIKFLEKYHTPIVVGSAIATAQNLIQIYAPSWASYFVDGPIDTSAGALPAGSSSDGTDINDTTSALPAGMTAVDDDPNNYVYNDQFDGGRSSQVARQQPSSSSVDTDDSDDLSDLTQGSTLS